MNDKVPNSYIELTAGIVSAYVSNNAVAAGDISSLISQVHTALVRISNGQSEIPVDLAKPAIAVKKSITPDYIICLEDGKKFKSLKRHLRTQYDMTPEHYREKWGLASAGLPDGGPELRRSAFPVGEKNGPRTTAKASRTLIVAAAARSRPPLRSAHGNRRA